MHNSCVSPVARKPAVLIAIAEPGEAGHWWRYLERGGCRVYGVIGGMPLRRRVLGRSDAVLAIVEGGQLWLGASDAGLPVIGLCRDGQTHAGVLGSGTSLRVLDHPVDRRQVIALAHAAAIGRFGVDVAIRDAGHGFGIVPGLDLVFWGERPLRLPVSVRRVLCSLAVSSDRLVTWQEIMTMMGWSRSSVHVCIRQIRKSFWLSGVALDPIETVRGKGVRWRSGQVEGPRRAKRHAACQRSRKSR